MSSQGGDKSASLRTMRSKHTVPNAGPLDQALLVIQKIVSKMLQAMAQDSRHNSRHKEESSRHHLGPCDLNTLCRVLDIVMTIYHHDHLDVFSPSLREALRQMLSSASVATAGQASAAYPHTNKDLFATVRRPLCDRLPLIAFCQRWCMAEWSRTQLEVVGRVVCVVLVIEPDVSPSQLANCLRG